MNPLVDYTGIHLSWIKRHDRYIPVNHLDYTENYYDVMKSCYATLQASPSEWVNSFAYGCYIQDEANFNRQNIEIARISKTVKSTLPALADWYFVTIGFNHQTFDIDKVKFLLSKIIMMSWIISVKCNFELYRENGEHPHAHFLIKTDLKKGDIIYKLFRPKYVTDLVLNRSFIDVKVAEFPRHFDYINFTKKAEKMSCVEKDKKYREENNVPDYEKNFSGII